MPNVVFSKEKLQAETLGSNSLFGAHKIFALVRAGQAWKAQSRHSEVHDARVISLHGAREHLKKANCGYLWTEKEKLKMNT